MNRAKPIDIPALISLYQSLSQFNARLRELDASLELGDWRSYAEYPRDGAVL
jgi:hypothetical protein